MLAGGALEAGRLARPATSLSIGCGSGYSNDRLDLAADLAGSGLVSYLGFDCLAERTLALAQMQRRADPDRGHDQRIGKLPALLRDYLAAGGRMVGNFGAANPTAAQRDCLDGLRATGLTGVRVGVIEGDDVLDLVTELDCELPELGSTVSREAHRVVSANAYIGADGVVDCLAGGAQIVIGGRLSDPSIFVGPICHELGWQLDDWPRVALATMAGHLLECGVHSTGGNYEDPPFRFVPDPHNLGFPYAVVEDGSVVLRKLPGTGGRIDRQVVRSQLYFEICDPRHYPTPDVTADFSEVLVEEVGEDQVRLSGVTGRERPDRLKVLVGLDLGWRALGEASYGGPGAIDRARRAEEIIRRRLEPVSAEIAEIDVSYHGVNALFGDSSPSGQPSEVRLRVAAQCHTEAAARAVAYEAEYLYFGPAAAGGMTSSVSPAIGVTPAYVPRARVRTDFEVVTA
ncbi:acyclic terpene utilization AtuA family protein [Polymorphospora sp. 2-325]|uniref:Acyclic terpene utilization AtuA family protein n=1 Tax=Polymorphospora lycopeni TaxID=3140240 RepID=A0ABV5CQH0_9ACTN